MFVIEEKSVTLKNLAKTSFAVEHGVSNGSIRSFHNFYVDLWFTGFIGKTSRLSLIILA